TLTIDFGNFQTVIPPDGIDFQGGIGTNTLALAGALLSPSSFHQEGASPANGTLDFNGLSIHFTDAAFVTGVPPVMTSLQIDTSTAVDGDLVTISGSFTDPGSLSSHSVFVVAGDGRFGSASVPAGSRQFSVTFAVGEGNPLIIPVTITDNNNLR